MFVPLPLIPGEIAVITSEVVVDVWCGTAHGDGALARFSRGRMRHLAHGGSGDPHRRRLAGGRALDRRVLGLSGEAESVG
jgi:hypothetical protein